MTCQPSLSIGPEQQARERERVKKKLKKEIVVIFVNNILNMRNSLTVLLMFVPCVLARVSHNSISNPAMDDTRISRHSVLGFSYPVLFPKTIVRQCHRQFTSHRFLSKDVISIVFRGQPVDNDSFLSKRCQKSDSETSNSTESKFPSWETGIKQMMEGIDFELMKNDLSLISIYSLGDSIIEVCTTEGIFLLLRPCASN
jgi:hypothetical protein